MICETPFWWLFSSHIFTADPRGMLKLWRLSDSLRSGSSVVGSTDVLLVAEFISCFAARIMCLDVSVEEEVFVSHLFFHIILLINK